MVHLTTLYALDVDTLKKSNRALIVNFNRDLKGTPKWGIVDLAHSGVGKTTIYCETTLLEAEKKELETHLAITDSAFIGAGANSLPSTGYTALAWLDINITKAWNFDISADFAQLMKDYLFVVFVGDNPGRTFNIYHQDSSEFCTSAFLRIGVPIFHDEIQARSAGRTAMKLCDVAVLGQWQGVSFRPGDIAAVIQIIEKQDVSLPTLTLWANKSQRTSPPGFSKTMSKYSNPKLIVETNDDRSIELKIPRHINKDDLNSVHIRTCAQTNTNPAWLLGTLTALPRSGSDQEYIAATMVLTLIRTKAKKRILGIDLPQHFQLNKEEQDFIVATLHENAYVTECNINNNASLIAIRNQLLPTFARNRWVEVSGYRPPMVDDYWKQAAK